MLLLGLLLLTSVQLLLLHCIVLLLLLTRVIMNLRAVNYPLITATAARIYLALLLQTIAGEEEGTAGEEEGTAGEEEEGTAGKEEGTAEEEGRRGQ